MTLSERQLLHSLNRMPFIDTAELAGVLGEAPATIHRALTGLLAVGIAGRVNHGTAHLPSSRRFDLTAQGITEVAVFLGFATPSDFVRAYPVSHRTEGRESRRAAWEWPSPGWCPIGHQHSRIVASGRVSD